jgi:hypothetical protein
MTEGDSAALSAALRWSRRWKYGVVNAVTTVHAFQYVRLNDDEEERVRCAANSIEESIQGCRDGTFEHPIASQWSLFSFRNNVADAYQGCSRRRVIPGGG